MGLYDVIKLIIKPEYIDIATDSTKYIYFWHESCLNSLWHGKIVNLYHYDNYLQDYKSELVKRFSFFFRSFGMALAIN